MAKKKTNKSASTPKRLMDGLVNATHLTERGKHLDALELLFDLDVQYHNNVDVLSMIAEVYEAMGNHFAGVLVLYRIAKLQPNKPDAVINFAFACVKNNYFGLAEKYFSQFIKQFANHEYIDRAKAAHEKARKFLEVHLAANGLSVDADWTFPAQHDEFIINMRLGNFEQCKSRGKALLAIKPDFLPVLNNLCEIYYHEGNISLAIEHCQRILAMAPDNVHALANITRYLYIKGHKVEADAMKQRLMHSKADAFGYFEKKVEALSFAGDDVGVLALLSEYQAVDEPEEDVFPLAFHAACAEYRMGRHAVAKTLWENCLNSPSYKHSASKNLAELGKEEHERICPQEYVLSQLFSKKLIDDLLAIGRHEKQAGQKKLIDGMIESHPEIIEAARIALVRGDENARRFFIDFIRMTDDPWFLDLMKSFALSKDGADHLRLKTMEYLMKKGLFASGVPIMMWCKGKEQEVLLFGFNITGEPTKPDDLSLTGQRIMEKGVMALQAGNGVEAERLFRKGVALHPDNPSFWNNLGCALNIQKLESDAVAIEDHLIENFPDYFYSQYFQFTRALNMNDLDRATKIVEKMMARDTLHLSEFSLICKCQVDLAMERNDVKGCDNWLSIWRQGYADDPKLAWVESDYEEYKYVMQKLAKAAKRRSTSQ